MRDDNHSRNYPPNDPSRRPPAGAGNAQGGDPLAELARLIGQNDPFSDFARDPGRAPAPAHDSRRPDPNSNPMPSDWQSQPAPYRDAPHRGRHPQRRRASAALCARRARTRCLPRRARRAARISESIRRAGTGRTIRAAGLRTAGARLRSATARGFDPQQFDPQQTRGYDPQQSRGSIRSNSTRSDRSAAALR